MYHLLNESYFAGFHFIFDALVRPKENVMFDFITGNPDNPI